MSVTYGAGGTTRDRTNAAIQTILGRARLNVAGHLTCVGASREETLDVARGYARMGVRRIVALRGDPPKGETRFVPHPRGFASAAELVAGLRSVGDFEVAVAAYPEVHPEAASPEADIDNLKRKLDAGACDGDHPVLLRERGLPALPRRLRQGGDHRADPAGHPAGREFRARC